MLESVCWEMNGGVSLRLYKACSGAEGSVGHGCSGARPARHGLTLSRGTDEPSRCVLVFPSSKSQFERLTSPGKY